MLDNHFLIPILNKSFVTFRKSTWYLDEETFITQIRDADFGAWHRDASEEMKSFVTPNMKCVYKRVPPDADKDTILFLARTEATIIRFVFGIFSKNNPAILPLIIYLTSHNKNKTLRVSNIFEFPITSDVLAAKKLPYRFRNTSVEEVSTYYKTVHNAVSIKKHLLSTIDRYNSSLTRTFFFDKLLDLSISLETLISGTSELSYKFALYNSLIATADPVEREEIFAKLSTLYKARSTIVHGGEIGKNVEKKLIVLESQWPDFVHIGSLCLNYFIFFLHSENPDSWNDHLRGLALGSQTRILN